MKQGYFQIKPENIDFKIDYNGTPVSISTFFPNMDQNDCISLKDLVDAGAWTLTVVQFNHKLNTHWQQLFTNE